MILIVGLGNPGKKYKKTRHNVGYLVVDQINVKCKEQSVKQQLKIQNFKLDRKFNAEILMREFDGEKIILAKSQTYMNNSGEVVKKIIDYYKINDKDIWMICDDINLDLGQIRVRKSGSDGGHNGLKSIIQHLGTQEFVRFRVGVGSNRIVTSNKRQVTSRITTSDPSSRAEFTTGRSKQQVTSNIPAEKYVLEKFSKNEDQIIRNSIDKTAELVVSSIFKGIKEETVNVS